MSETEPAIAQRGEATALLVAKLPSSLREAIRARADAVAQETGVKGTATAVIRQALEAYLAAPFSLDTLTAGRVIAGHPRMDLLQGALSKTGVTYKLPISLIEAVQARAATGTDALHLLGGDGHISVTDVLTAALAVELVGSPREVIDEHRNQLMATLRDQDQR